MSQTYEAMITDASKRLAAILRANPPAQIFVFAVFTDEARDGWIHIGADYPAGVPASGLECVRPQGYMRWESTPYSQQIGALREALRRSPILPYPPGLRATLDCEAV